jgi:sugar phosphate isomerase/epimerase
MILQSEPPVHLTYCMNIHPGENWVDQLGAIQDKAAVLRQMIKPDDWFGLGLRLGAQAVADLANAPDSRRAALDVFAENQLYPFTVNAFPYGRFHAGPVKENVYAPDWRTPERREYTFDVCDILAEWLPEGIEGSISTVPVSFKSWIRDRDGVSQVAQNLAAVVAYLAAVREDTGKEIHLGLEPEPSCYLETTEETVRFFKEVMWRDGVEEIKRIRKCYTKEAEAMMRRHLGVCFDTCHVALQFEEPVDALQTYLSEGIRISKVQLSSALVAPNTLEAREALGAFAEPTYLHQVKVRDAEGVIHSWVDLSEALNDLEARAASDEIRVHFHVPLFFTQAGPLTSTSGTLCPAFFKEIRRRATTHLEIETYTFDVLPKQVHPGDIVRSISREYMWVMEHF